MRLLRTAVLAILLALITPVSSASHAVDGPVATLAELGSSVNSPALSTTIGIAFSGAYDDVLSDVCELIPRLNDYGFTYDESVFCPTTATPAFYPDFSVAALCHSILSPAGATIVDVATSKTSAWTLDSLGVARGCVFPQFEVTDIKSLVSRYRTSMIQYRNAGFNDVAKAVDSCDGINSDHACQIFDGKTGAWIPDPKRLAALANPPMPAPIAATALSFTGVAAITSGDGFQVFSKVDGSVVSRCDTAVPSEAAGQCLAPSTVAGSLRISASGRHAVAVKPDGSVVEWGSTTVAGISGAARAPSGLSGVVDAAAGQDFAVALRGDGTLTAWGDNSVGQTTIPNNATDIVALSAGRCHVVALKSNGMVVSWGCNNEQQLFADGRPATAVKARGDRTFIWGTDGQVQSFGVARPASAPTDALGAVISFDTASGAYTQFGTSCAVDKGEDVIRDDIADTSPKSEAPLNLSTASTPADSTDWVYTWSAPQRTGTSRVTSYLGRFDHDKGRHFSAWIPMDSPFRAPKAPPGWLARFEVRAVTAAGNGVTAHIATSESKVCGDNQTSDFALVLRANQAVAPVAPTMTAMSPAATQIRVAWTSPQSAGSATRLSYQITLSTDGKSWTSAPTRGFVALLTGLKPATTYQLHIVATNSAGSTASATASVQTLTDAIASSVAVGNVVGRSVSLTWKAPTTVVSKAITDYRIDYSTDGLAWTSFAHKASNKTAITVTGLFSLTSYQFRIVTVTTTGTGAPSSIVMATTKADVPGAVTGMSAGAISAAGFTVTWLAPVDNGGSPITNYVVSSKPAASKIVVTGTSAVLTGVKLGSVYEVKIAAVNAKGTGQTTSAKFLVATVPASPTVTVTRTLSSVTVMWKAAKDTGGSKVASYVTAITPNTIAYTVTSGKAVIANLAPGTRFTFSVSSVNAVGASIPTTVSTGTATAPGVVSALGYATKDAKTLLVTWALPTDDGGSKITGYRIRTSIDGAKTWTAWSSVSKSPLTASRPAPGATLQVEISAVNLYGIGTSSGITIKG